MGLAMVVGMTECLARPVDGQGIVSSFPDRRVCVLGLGYVGLTLAAVLADVGFTVLGVEPRREVLARLADGRTPVREPGLEELLARVVARGDLRTADRIPADVDATVFIVTVGTPLDERGAVRLDMVENAVRDVAAHLRDGDLVVMRSTVGLGTTRAVVEPILAATGGGSTWRSARRGRSRARRWRNCGSCRRSSAARARRPPSGPRSSSSSSPRRSSG